MKTIQLLLRSRKVITALAAFIAAIIAEAGWIPGVPEERILEVVQVIVALAVSVIAGTAYEDAAKPRIPSDPPVPPPLEVPRGDHG